MTDQVTKRQHQNLSSVARLALWEQERIAGLERPLELHRTRATMVRPEPERAEIRVDPAHFKQSQQR